MKQLLLFTVNFFAALLLNAQANDTLAHLLSDSLPAIKQRVERSIIPARYMEQQLLQTTDTLHGWEHIPVSLYEYKVDNGRKTGKVYMANADAGKLATWIITTCYTITNKLDKKHTDLLIKTIRNASGGQFPVLGIVYENMDGTGYVPYVFKDGVTVFLINRTEDSLALITDANIRKTGKYARITSTTREEYKSLFPGTATEGIQWLVVVRDAYKSALQSDTNRLMIAWAKGKLQ